MHKPDYKKLAFLGLASGLVILHQGESSAQVPEGKDFYLADTAGPNNKCGNNWCGGKIAIEDKQAAAPTLNLNKTQPEKKDLNAQNVGYHLMNEDELLLQLNDEGAKLFNQMTPEEKKITLSTASARCQGTNECAGLNACQTEKNACAGKGSCKATGKCAIADKNLAVKLVWKKLSEKRIKAASGVAQP